jgi:hypothetical protein
VNTEFSGFIRASSDHTSCFGITTYNYRFPFQLGSITLLDGGVERIHVDMDNFTDGLHGILNSVHPEIVDFGSGQGLSVFATTGIVCLFRGLQKSENAALGQKMQKSENAALGQKMLFPDEH